MAEVFTISGAPAFGASCPTGWGATSSGYCSAVGGGAAPAARNLQQALVALGNAVRDGVLMAIKADGIIGPGTTAAVNRAFTTHIGPGQAGATFRTGKLTIFDVAQYAADLTKLLSAETLRRGVAPPAAVPGTYTPPTADPSSSAAQIPSPAAPLPEKSSTALWAMGGLALLAVGVGIYFMTGGGSSAMAGSLEGMNPRRKLRVGSTYMTDRGWFSIHGIYDGIVHAYSEGRLSKFPVAEFRAMVLN